MHKAIATLIIAFFTLSFVLPFSAMEPFFTTASFPLEQTISHRRSTRNYTSENISSNQLLEVLWAAYGYANDHKSTPQIGYDHSLIIFPVNTSGSFQYIPENNSLIIHNQSVNKETIRPHDQSWPSDASVVLVVVWNQTKMSNGYFASAEAGCLVQNVYLAAASLDLGTCCVGGVNSGGLRNDLKLPGTLIPLLVMPLGYPATPYPPASPNFDCMTGNLPPVQYSDLSFEDALRNMHFARDWATENLSLQELSQLLWAAYGYTNVTSLGGKKEYHKTTPDSWGWYSLVIFVSNATGVYKYLPDSSPNATPTPDPNHSVKEILHGDKRLDIANACSSQIWAADAPAIFLIVYNSSYNDGNTGDGGTLPHEFMEVNAGAVIQELFLEAAAWNLSANVVSEGLEEWNGTGAEELRNILDLSSSIIPLYLVPVGHKTWVSEHDIAVKSVVPSKTVVGKGYFTDINVTIQNQGEYEETFIVTLYVNATIITLENINLMSKQSTTIASIWNTTDFAKGNYILRAYASPVTNETDTSDNELIDGLVYVTIPGDVDADRDVDIFDIVLMAYSYSSEKGDPLYQPNYDMNSDEKIDIFDIVIAATNYGKNW